MTERAELIAQIKDRHASKFHSSRSDEVRYAVPWKITDDTFAALQELVVGRSITAISREPNSPHDWAQGENGVVITLDDGSNLYFSGWGYDASGCDTSYEPPITD